MLMRVLWPQHSTGELSNKGDGMRSTLRRTASSGCVPLKEARLTYVVQTCDFNRSAAMTQVRICGSSADWFEQQWRFGVLLAQ